MNREEETGREKGKENGETERTDEIHMGMKSQGRIVEFGLVYMCEEKKNRNNNKNRQRPKKGQTKHEDVRNTQVQMSMSMSMSIDGGLICASHTKTTV